MRSVFYLPSLRRALPWSIGSVMAAGTAVNLKQTSLSEKGIKEKYDAVGISTFDETIGVPVELRCDMHRI